MGLDEYMPQLICGEPLGIPCDTIRLLDGEDVS